MRVFVWVEAWQQQCCGSDFRVGSEMQWQVKRYDEPSEGIELFLGPEWAKTVTYAEDHHMGEAEADLSGVVEGIKVVTRALELRLATEHGPPGPISVSVPHSGQLREVDVADKWEPEPRDEAAEWSFDGWIVELEVG